MKNNMLYINVRPDFEVLRKKISAYNPDANWTMLEQAFDLAQDLHKEQKRVDGTPYFVHPFNVSLILSELKMDTVCICAGLLHDVVEDTEITADQISEKFTPSMARLIRGVTKISKMAYKSRVEQQAENIRKMLLAMSEDIRVIIIKLADRLHNIMTLGALPIEKQKRIAQETVDIYAPLAHRLGMHGIKSLLEDYCFKALNREQHDKIKKELEETTRQRNEFVDSTIKTLNDELKANNIKASIYGRVKHMFSIFKKMDRTGRRLDEIYDLLAVRVITRNVRECYTTLGIIHDIWTPIPGRFKDYIAIPKQNMYQSLHTTVMQKKSGSKEGMPMEIQIRTEEMDNVAEVGIAAHWDYKEVKTPNDNAQVNTKIAWLRQLIDWHSEIQDATDFMHNLKNDLFQDEVFVFTPAGDIIALPFSATPLDFAFTVHTEVGLRCTGAKVNGKIVTLDYSLRNGDVVEVMTSNRANPNQSWLNIVKSHRAKNKIRQYLRKQERDTNLAKGKDILRNNLERMRKELARDDNSPVPLEEMNSSSIVKSERLQKFIDSNDYRTVEDIYVALGSEKLSFSALFNKLFPEWLQYRDVQNRMKQLKKKSEKPISTNGIIVEGIDNPMINFSRCCNPIPGDRIIGYITRGKGISVHRKDCPNLKSLVKEKERFITVKWDENEIKQTRFRTWVRAEVSDRPSMLFDITHLLSSQMKLNILSMKARSNAKGGGIIDLQVELRELDKLDEIISAISRISEVKNVFRLK